MEQCGPDFLPLPSLGHVNSSCRKGKRKCQICLMVKACARILMTTSLRNPQQLPGASPVTSLLIPGKALRDHLAPPPAVDGEREGQRREAAC